MKRDTKLKEGDRIFAVYLKDISGAIKRVTIETTEKDCEIWIACNAFVNAYSLEDKPKIEYITLEVVRSEIDEN